MLDPTKELYFSFDVETNGPIPGQNSMLSLGCAAFEAFNDKPISEFSCNFDLLIGATEDSNTMAFWDKNQDAYDKTRQFCKTPLFNMQNLNSWVLQISKARNKKPVAVAYPAGFDFMFVYWYLMYTIKKSPFSFSCLDIKTLAFATNQFSSYKETKKRNFPAIWIPKGKHTHVAIDDAIEQGKIFINVMKYVFKPDKVAAVSEAASIVEALTASTRVQQG